jgi:transposase-like protein
MVSRAVCRCPACNTDSVVPVREDPKGVQLWKCSQCGEVKRWCPCCDQGWVTRAILAESGHVLYVCDECDASWLDSSSIGGVRAESLEPYMQRLGVRHPWKTLSFQREFE